MVTRWLLGAWFVALLAIQVVPAQAAPPIFPVHEAIPGLMGVGYTVVQGTEIERFSVEVLGVMKNAGPSGSLILVRVDGDPIDRAGGIAAGMSGSPVYVDGKLLGAIGYAFGMTDHRVGLVTPAGDMLDVMALIDDQNESIWAGPGSSEESDAPHTAPLTGSSAVSPEVRGVALAQSPEDAARLQESLPPGVWVAQPVMTPMVVSGLGRRAMDRLERTVSGFDVIPLIGGGVDAEVGSEATFEPGSALGVQLVRGDIDVTAIGTVTAVDEGRFIAFGHPFLKKGPVGFIATKAYILHTVPSIESPFKLGAPLEPVGALMQDRGAAVAGRIGDPPPRITLAVRVRDGDRSEDAELTAELVRDDTLTVPLAVISALEALDRSLDRIGRGTAWVSFRFQGDGMPQAVERSNVYYSSTDIAAASLFEFLAGARLLQENPFKRPHLRSIDLNVRVEEERHTAQIEEARPDAARVEPGETVNVRVTLRPFRGESYETTIPLAIPVDSPPGPVTVTVHGGGYGLYGMLPQNFEAALAPPEGDEDDPEDEPPVPTRAESLEKLIGEFESQAKNNELIAEYYPNVNRYRRPTDPDRQSGADESSKESDPQTPDEEELLPPYDAGFEPEPAVRAVQPTEYVLRGETWFTLVIEAQGGESPSGDDEAEEPSTKPGKVFPRKGTGPRPL